MEWPALSIDLNPIEYLWNELRRRQKYSLFSRRGTQKGLVRRVGSDTTRSGQEINN